MSNDKVVKVVKLREKPTRNSYKQYFIGIPIELVRKWERKKGKKPNQVMIEETEEGAVLRVM